MYLRLTIDGHNISGNKSVPEFFKCDMETIVKTHWREFVSKNHYKHTSSQFDHIFRYKTSALYVNENLISNGDVELVRWHLQPVIHQGKLVEFYATGLPFKNRPT